MESLNIKNNLSLKRLLQLERCGRYDEAIQELGSIWQDKSLFPIVDNFDKPTAAEIILRCGCLIGFLGYNKQIPNSQEKSRNLLTEARERFLDIYNQEKIAECENYLALSYSRKGELIEARVWLEEAFSHDLSNSSDARLYSHLVSSILTNNNKKYEKTIENFKLVESDFRRYGDYYLNGTISSNVGVAYRNSRNTVEALKYFELSGFYHKKSKHQIYLGTVENNTALLYKSLQKYSKAHQSIDNGIKVFKEVKDRTKHGFSLDTKAQIYLDEGKFNQALYTVEEGINILRAGENIAYLVETFSTKIKILVYLDKIAEASLCLSEAVNLAEVHIGEDKARQLAEGFAKAIKDNKAPVVTNIYTEKELKAQNIELVIPPELSHYEEIQGVWIKNKHLEKTGLKKGSLAIIANEKVEKGDLVAIIETENQDVSCGFYDSDFGVICIERPSSEPQLFNEGEIQILGKIIGVAESSKTDGNKMYVEPTKLTQY